MASFDFIFFECFLASMPDSFASRRHKTLPNRGNQAYSGLFQP